jgi:hypothetical protein
MKDVDCYKMSTELGDGAVDMGCVCHNTVAEALKV